MVNAPWEGLPEEDQLFVLVTGANSGIGLATCERIIDEFLLTRPLTAQLVLLPTTRSASKASETISHLRTHALASAQRNLPGLKARSSDDEEEEELPLLTPESTAERVHILSPTLDLCNLKGIQQLGHTLCFGRLSNPGGGTGVFAQVSADGGRTELESVRIPRLDAIICNAGFGGWSGFDFLGATWQMATQGIPKAVTWPTFKTPMEQRMLGGQQQQMAAVAGEGESEKEKENPLAEVFTACFFGHYLLANALMPLLHRREGCALPPARLIWSSSVEAVEEFFNVEDIQSLKNPNSYESAKRLTDIISLTSSLPSTRPFAASFSKIPEHQLEDARLKDSHLGGITPGEATIPPKMYLTHPGVVVSTLFPVPWFLMWAYSLVLLIARYLGSPWHNMTPYPGAASATYITLSDQPTLDALHAERVKWGSSTNRSGRDAVKMTEVDGWGWEGKEETVESVANCGAEGVLRKRVGRKDASRVTKKEDVERFEEEGRRVWEQVEGMRKFWMGVVEEKGALDSQLNG